MGRRTARVWLDSVAAVIGMIDLRSTVEAVLHKAPDWIRRDLHAKEAGERLRAEEALAAMICAALAATA